jgi:hydroxymethylpyrimidine/phosphomethylpyrimidine kinase
LPAGVQLGYLRLISEIKTPPVALTIAGSDSGGGAGIQADLKTFATHAVFGASVITTVTAQNTVGVRAIDPVRLSLVAAQLAAVLDDLPVRAVKTGMLATPETVSLVGRWAARLPNLVVDPVLVSSTGQPLFSDEARRAYLEDLFPPATVVTPNLREAAVLLGREVSTVDDMTAAARALSRTGTRCVVVKGGRLIGATEAVDVVWYDGEVELLRAPWIATANNHGTGCTFAAATAARLAHGDPLPEALRKAKSYVHRAIAGATGWRLGAGHGPLAWDRVWSDGPSRGSRK